MKYVGLFCSFALGLGIAAAACGDDGSESPGTTTTTTTGEGGSGAAPGCPTVLEAPCGTCMGDACCEDLTACEDDPDCWACVHAQDSDACERTPETHDRVDRYLVCRGGACQQACIAGGNGDCEGRLDNLYPAACAECLQASCCDEIANCAANDACWIDCYTMHDTDACHGNQDGHALYHALGACFNATDCASACSAPPIAPACDAPVDSPSAGVCVPTGGACNPVTNEGCPDDGSACDINQGGTFQCFPPPSPNATCEACGSAAGWCAPGNTCAPGGKCARYCCDDADCGTGTCDKDVLGVATVGLCVEAN
ncbi:hypothetical protein [Chondromyces crocatus]|uniref:Tryptophan synthase alpha chain n=1 Tax=Chondromyces crocatus TaxID=52 RepID=A0A0K1ECN7_CHOCO|nr:hypothetical protein [Chondromyces crocatus]AKT38631.1 uncharacterized protein CMC5_027780 [Chondromyces crocatus]